MISRCVYLSPFLLVLSEINISLHTYDWTFIKCDGVDFILFY
jgi:hypothetical protein